MAISADLPGSAGLELVDGVVHLDPKPAMLEAMLAGWARQQRARFLSEEGTIKPRVLLVRRLVDFTTSTRGSGSRWTVRSGSAEPNATGPATSPQAPTSNNPPTASHQMRGILHPLNKCSAPVSQAKPQVIRHPA